MHVSELIRSKVVTESGEKLGHVFDVRVARRSGSSPERADQQWHLESLLIGSRGLRERFGFTPGEGTAPVLRHDQIPWDAVVRLEDGVVVVHDGAASG